MQEESPCHISITSNGFEGLTQAKVTTFDFIITDFSMPQMNGKEFIGALRNSEGPNQKTPILMLTGMMPDLDSLKDYNESIFFLEKPCSKEKTRFYLKCCSKLKPNR